MQHRCPRSSTRFPHFSYPSVDSIELGHTRHTTCFVPSPLDATVPRVGRWRASANESPLVPFLPIARALPCTRTHAPRARQEWVGDSQGGRGRSPSTAALAISRAVSTQRRKDGSSPAWMPRKQHPARVPRRPTRPSLGGMRPTFPPHLVPAPMLSHELSSGGDRIDQCAFRDPFRRIRSRIARRDGDVRAFARVQSQARAGRGRAGRPGGARGIRTRRGRVQEGGTDRSTNRCAWKDVQETRAGSRT